MTDTIKLANDREFLWQWDVGQGLIVPDGVSEVHYGTPMMENFYVFKVDDTHYIPILDRVLQRRATELIVYEYLIDGQDGHTMRRTTFRIKSRKKPANYQATPDQAHSMEWWTEQAEEILGDAVGVWLDEHPDVTTTIQDGEVTIPKLNSQVWDRIDQSIGQAEIDLGSQINTLDTKKADKTEVNSLATEKADKTDVNALSDRVDAAKNDIDVLDARMDTFASLPSGSTSGNAELVDIRVGVDGTTYPSAGDAVRGQVSDLKSEIDEIKTSVATSANLRNPSTLATGAIQSDGTIATNGAWGSYLTSDFIELEPDTDYYFAVYGNTDEHIVWSGSRKLLLLYDANKAVVANSYQNSDSVTHLTFNTSSNIKYVRVSSSATIQQVAKGATYGAYVPYAEKAIMIAELGDTPIAQVQDIINNSGIITYEAGKNLANPDTMVVGAIQSNGTVATSGAWSNYKTSDYIEIEPSTGYVASTWSDELLPYANRMFLLLFDENKLPIANAYQNVDAVTNLTFSNASAKYVRVSVRDFDDLHLQVEKGSTPTTYEAYSGKNVLGYPLGRVPMAQAQSDNPLYKKKWAVCGDSFTNGATENRLKEGKYKGRRIVYPYIIGNHNEMEIVRHFAGGQTLANPSDGTFTNSLTNSSNPLYYQNIPADADYITIYLGINDENHYRGWSPDGESTSGYIELGTIDDATSATYYGAWNEVLTWLITNRPFAHIGIIVCNGLGASEYQGVSGSDWRDAQIAIAEKYGVPYIDLNGDKQTPAMIRSVNPKLASNIKTVIDQKQAVDYPNNTHPNDDAHLYESYFIEDFLRSI